MTTEATQAALDQVLRIRGVEVACETCHGLGVRGYGSTATWRGGQGGARPQKDVCDACWGTGDAHRHGVNLRKMAEEERARVAEAALHLFADKAGIALETMRPAVHELAKELDALSRKSRVTRPPWFGMLCELMAKTLREGLNAAERRETR